MDYTVYGLAVETLAGAVPMRRIPVRPDQLRSLCSAVHEAGGFIHALWASDVRDTTGGFLLRVALQDDVGLVVIELLLPAATPHFPSIADIFPAADRMQRAAYDLLGVRAEAADRRSWVRHAAWPDDCFPLRHDYDATRPHADADERYPFVRVTGDGVHEIAVGPVHAGTIEPAHFRFSVVGEKVLRIEERLGYTHKGIEKRFETLPALQAHKLAARVSGDSAVAFSWAYCMALEMICGISPPVRAIWLRALYLERERIANHLGDLGALGNDAGFSIALAQFSRLKEDLLRINQAAFGARYLMDVVVPGGVARDLDETHRQILLETIPGIESELNTLREIYDDHAGLQDRFSGTGRVAPALARQLGLVGLAGRASGQTWDWRCDPVYAPYDALNVRIAGSLDGDVAGRVSVRFQETFESLRLSRIILENLPRTECGAALPDVPAGGFGVGLVEGWRGPVLVALETGDGGRIRRCHPHDPSWQNWPVVEHATIGNIVPDFPLINKSFNLSYSGQDL
ncbi:MAG: NADH-quinone oxidoreductase subunit C [Gammaproteobacteria bacterium]|nr:NADH-quinone oxidoreductase subunit C [Gammaproteobacteria bacterium]